MTDGFQIGDFAFIDTTPPTVTITAPTQNQRWSNSVFNVTGKASDDVGVATVFYQLNGAGWSPATTANNWSNWTASVNLGPSEKLLKDVLAGRIGWGEFSRRYRKEIFESRAIDLRNRMIKNHGQKFTLRLLQKLAKSGTVTLMCHCAEDQSRCHRHILQRILKGKV